MQALAAAPRQLPRKPWLSASGRSSPCSSLSLQALGGNRQQSAPPTPAESPASRHEVRSPVPVQAPVGLEEEETAAAFFDFKVPEDGHTAPELVWFEVELKARLAAIDDRMRKLSVLDGLDHKIDEVLRLTRQHAERPPDRERPPPLKSSPRSPRRHTFTSSSLFTAKDLRKKMTGEMGASSMQVVRLPPPPSRTEKATAQDAAEPAEEPERLSWKSFTSQGSLPRNNSALSSAVSGAMVQASSQMSVDNEFTNELRARNSQRHFVELWNFFEDEESSFFAKMYSQGMLPVIMFTVLLSLMQVYDDEYLRGPIVQAVEAFIECCFLVEVLARLLVLKCRLFWLDVYNLIDFASAMPLVLRACMGFSLFGQDGSCNTGCSLLMGSVPVIRLLKLLRRFQNFRLLLKAFQVAFEALPVLIFIWAILGLASAAALFVFEPRENVPTLPVAIWLAVVSMTTLGYGDISPQTTVGRIVICVLVMGSILYTAIPLGIIGSAFSEVWNDRDRLLLTQKARHKLQLAGYTAGDIPYLFKLFDADRDEQLDLDEFKMMVEFMRVGFHGPRVVELFDLFDEDGSGAIDDREFVKALFPESYHDLFGAPELKDGMKACECGNVFMSDAKFCRKCGKRRSTMEEEEEGGGDCVKMNSFGTASEDGT